MSGAVQEIVYSADRDDVIGELVMVNIAARDGKKEQLHFWAEGRLPFEEGDLIDGKYVCKRAGRKRLACDGSFSIGGRVAMLVSGTGSLALTDGWRVEVGERLPKYAENDRWIRAEHVLIVGHGDTSVELGRSSSRCQIAQLAGASWLISGGARQTEWKAASRPVENEVRYSIVWARRAR